MRKSLVSLLLAVGATAFVANMALASPDDGDVVNPKLMNANMSKELQSRATRLGSSATTVDTTYIGYTPGKQSASNYWSIWSGSDKFSVPTGPYHRPPAQGAMWDFDGPYINGDSLQGWWSVRSDYTTSRGTLPDYNRPWRALDYGNDVNYSFGAGRTYGVVGMWHVDGGNTVAAPGSTTWTGEPAGSGGVKWAPLTGSASAWMGMRRHGDNTHVDDVARGGTGNPYNEDAHVYQPGFASTATGGSDKKFPGYAAAMDQMLYRDIDLSGAGDSTLTVSFQYRTSMSTGFSTNNATRTGWFVHDPLTVITGGSNPNFVSATGPTPTIDSLMVYVGAPAEGSVLLSDGASHTIYDAKRRWFGEVIRSNEGLYKQIHGSAGTATSRSTVTIPSSVLGPLKAAGANKVRLVFRVKTNTVFDDASFFALAYTSGGVGAAIIDSVAVAKGAAALSVIGAFETAATIDNRTSVTALTAWKSTGKPAQTFFHPHFLSNGGPSVDGLLYQDLCGQVGNPARICDMKGVVVSAGDHDNDERSGDLKGTPNQEIFGGMWSPVIQLAAGGTANSQGLTASTADATDDYYIDYDMYTGIFNYQSTGVAWRFGFRSYPGSNSATGVGEHARWGENRFPPFIFFNPDKQCFRDLEPVKGYAMLRTNSPDGIPDSCQIYLGTRQESYRFPAIIKSDWTDGAYFDNVSLDVVDGAGADPVTMSIWDLFNDTFPANENSGLVGTPASFDTTVALVRIGLNTAPATVNLFRFDVPGDTALVSAEGDSVRLDMVFRILPGPGNYVNAAVGVNSQLRAVANNAAPIPAPASGVTNFWSNYMFSNGAKGSAGGHPTATSGPLNGQKIWSPNVWNSARMDTAQRNVFQLQKRGVLEPGNGGLFMTAYHENELNDAHRGALGISRNICFVADTATATPTTTIICGKGNVPAGVVYPPVWTSAPGSGYNGQTTTKEGTKIIPDGLLTPGAHVEYFFRRQDGNDPLVYLAPDTNVVTPQNSESSTDGHRWQEFGVLPDRWKSGAYTHPVLGTIGAGDACMLYVDQNDRRGNERTWVGVADSIGATASSKYGAHNGWHAPGDGDVNDPAFFVRRHIGQPGTTWDMYGVKAAESTNTGAGSLGSRGGVSALSFSDPSNTQIDPKSNRLGPSEAMLNAYYKILLVLTGDLNSGIFGPDTDKSQDDYRIMQNFLQSGNTLSPDRGIFMEGDGLVEAMDASNEGFTFMTTFLGVELRNVSYLIESGNTAFSADIISTTNIEGPGPTDIYGVRNACTFTLDVYNQSPGLSTETAASTFYEPFGIGSPYISGVLHNHTATNPWISLVDGWDIEVLRSRDEVSSRGRLTYFYNVFNNIFSAICDVNGAAGITTDTPRNNDGRLYNFMSLANNPLKSGSATINFGIAKAERVKIQIFDVSGRLVRTLADRGFTAGEHKLTWDGADNSGRLSARGVYFVRSQYADSKFTGQSKLIVLK